MTIDWRIETIPPTSLQTWINQEFKFLITIFGTADKVPREDSIRLTTHFHGPKVVVHKTEQMNPVHDKQTHEECPFLSKLTPIYTRTLTRS